MPRGCRTPILPGMLSALLLAGCSMSRKALLAPASQPQQQAPVHIAGTVGEYARLSGGGEMPVHGYGLVVGLGTNGSREVPAPLREYFTQYLLKRKIIPSHSESGQISPQTVLSDLDTAVVEVRGLIPAGSAPGRRFDVFVAALPQTQTRSLDGGILLPTELYFTVQGPTVSKRSRAWAEAEGPVFVNPFLDPNVPEDLAKFRQGRLIGGGEVKEGRTYRLQLRQADYQICNLIRSRINERFGRGEEIAKASNPAAVDLKVPAAYGQDQESFLRLVMHLPLSQGGALEAKAVDIASAAGSPGANHEELALVWEAIGRQVLPTARKHYSSANHLAAFYAARTGARLGDPTAAEVLARFARMDGSPLQLQAIEELGRCERSSVVLAALQPLVDDDNELVRIGAYEALLRQGDSARIRRISIKDQFNLDLVASTRNYVVFATQTGEPKLVLFGKDMQILRPVFFSAPEDLVTIHANQPRDQLTVIRKIPRTGKCSEPFSVDADVRSLVTTLGTLPAQRSDQRRAGLGLTYGQVVSVLYRMCKEGDIRAEFRLQQLPDVQRIYRDTVTVGRPDTPGS